jgi:hypothetical protein
VDVGRFETGASSQSREQAERGEKGATGQRSHVV